MDEKSEGVIKMLLREVKYYLMSYEQLEKEIMDLRFKLDTATTSKQIKRYLEALADIARVLIRKNRDDDDFMREVRWTLYSLKAQVEKAVKDQEKA